MTALWVLLAIVVVGMGYIRLAPSDQTRWHVSPRVERDADFAGGVARLLEGRAADLPALDAIIRATPRTKRLFGAVEDGRITYVTRSRVMGFPDYTTIEADGDDLRLLARLRFGQSDLGVNRNRVEGWLAQLEQIRSGG